MKVSTFSRLCGVLIVAALASSASANTVVWGSMGTGSSATVTTGGVAVTGSSLVQYTQSSIYGDDTGGLGIVGGGSSTSVDLGETITMNYGGLVNNVSMGIYDVDPPGNVVYSFEAFNGNTSIGTFSVPLHVVHNETKDLTSLAGGALFSKVTFSISSAPPIGLIFENTTFTQVPEPATLAGVAVLVSLCVARRSNRRV